MIYVIDTLVIFNKALDDQHQHVLDHFMLRNDQYGKEIAKEFHRIQLDETLNNDGLTEIVIKILHNLGVPPYQWRRYVGSSMSVYQFLLEIHELTKKKNAQLQKLIDHIDAKMGSFWYSLGIAAIFALFIFTFLIPFFIQSEVITLLAEIATAVLFIPSLRIIYNTGYALYSFYSGLFDTHIPLSHRIRNHVFEISSASIKIAASCLVMVMVATSPLVSILVVTATALSVINEAVSFIQLLIERRRKKDLVLVEESNPLARLQHQARLDNAFNKKRNDLIANIVAAVLITTIVAIWTFIPGGIPLAIAAITAMALVYVGKFLFQIYNERTKKKELLNTFDQLETEEREKALSPETGCNETVEFEQGMTYLSLRERLGTSPDESTATTLLPPDHYDPLFQISGGNEMEEKRVVENDSNLHAAII